jgi:alpha-ketoglutarate-dependent taurine dioxygenase
MINNVVVLYRAEDLNDKIAEIQDEIQRQGWCRIRTDIWERERALALLEALVLVLGPLIPHTRESQIADVTTVERFNDRSVLRPQSDNHSLFPHTDAVLSPELPGVLAMLCLSRAQVGGESILVDTRPFLVQQYPTGSIDALFDGDAVAIERGELRARVSVLRRRGKFINVALSDHEYNSVVPKPSCAAPFAALRAFAGNAAWQRRVMLNDGDLLLVANRFCLHGRAAFVDGPGGVRHLVRAWYRGPVPECEAFEGFATNG